MSRLILIRHEDAHPSDEGGDALRGLTGLGRARMYRQAQGLSEALPGLDRVHTSPLVRAVQTTEILLSAFDYDTHVVVDAHVLNPASLPFLAQRIQVGPSPIGVTAVIGHEPTLGVLTRYLIGDDSFTGFRTGQATLLAPVDGAYRVERAWRGGEPLDPRL